MRAVATGAFVLLCAASPAAACTLEPPWVPHLPNETAEQRSERQNQALEDRETIREYHRQQVLVEGAGNAFLGEVQSAAVTPQGHRLATVKPLLAVKGSLPGQSVRLENYDLPGCVPFPAIDGEGALASKGDLVFVFTGLETHPQFRPRGIDSLATNRILNETLVEALKTYGVEDSGE